MDGIKVIVAHVDLGRFESTCSMSPAVGSCTGFGPEQSEGAGALDSSSEFFRMLQKMFDSAPDSETEALSNAHLFTQEEDADEDESASSQLNPSAAVAQDSTMPALMPMLTVMPDAGVASQEAVPLDESSSNLRISLMHSSSIDSLGWRQMEPLHTTEDLPEAGMECSALGVDQAEPNLSIGLKTDVEDGHSELSAANGVDGVRVVPGVQEGEPSPMAPAATPPTQIRASEGQKVGGSAHTQLAEDTQNGEASLSKGGDASGGVPEVAIASRAAGSNPPADIPLIGGIEGKVGHVHADSEASLWNITPVLDNLTLFDDVESALFISGVSRTSNLGERGLAVQMEGVGRGGEDGGPHKVLRNAGMRVKHGSGRSSRGRNAETGIPNLAVGDGREAVNVTGGVQQLTPLLTGGNREHVDGDSILDHVTPAADAFFEMPRSDGAVAQDAPDLIGMDGAEQLREVVGEMPSDASHFAKAEAESGGILSDWNVWESHSGSHSNDIPDTDLGHAGPDAARGGNHDSSLVVTKDIHLSDGFSSANPGRVDLSDVFVKKGVDVSRETALEPNEGVDVEVGSGASPLSTGERPPSGVGFEFEAERVQLGVRPSADLGNRRISPGGPGTEPPEPQAGRNGILREEGRPVMQKAAPEIQALNGRTDEADTTVRSIVTTHNGHGLEAVETQKDSRRKSGADARREPILEQELEFARFGLRRAIDLEGMQIGLDGLREKPGETEMDMAPTEGMPPVEGKLPPQEIGHSVMQRAVPEIQAANGHTDEADTTVRSIVTTDHGHEMEAVERQKDSRPKNGPDARHELILEQESEPARFGLRSAADMDGMGIGPAGLRAGPSEMPIGTGPADGLMPSDGKALSQEAGRSVMQQVAAHIEARRSLQSGEFRVRLVPESLGEVQIRIRVQGRACTATIQVGNGEVGDYIEKHGADLKVLLAESGIDLADLSVSVGSHSASGDAGGQAHAEYAAAAFTGGGRRGRKEYGRTEHWFHDAGPRDVIASQESGHVTASIRSGYGRIDYFA